MNKIDRKIYFFRADVGLSRAGKLLPFDPCPSLKHIDSLSWHTEDRYWADETGKLTCCWVDQTQRHCKVRYGTIRREDLPQVEADGVLAPLGIPPRSGLAEQIHVVFFEDNVLGCDFNFYGPRLGRLADYMVDKAPLITPRPLRFEPLLRNDAADQLARLKQLRLFKLKIRPSFAGSVKRASKSLGDAFEAAFKAGQAEDVEIVLRPAPYQRTWLSKELLGAARRLLRHPAVRDEAGTFYVEGYDPDAREMLKLDLLNDKLVATRGVVKQEGRTRALNSSSAYAAIESAYDELREELSEAAEVIR